MNGNALIDRFVETLNGRGLESLPEGEVPSELRIGEPNEFGWCDWKIRAVDSNPWVAGLERSLAPYRFLRSISLSSRRYHRTTEWVRSRTRELLHIQ